MVRYFKMNAVGGGGGGGGRDLPEGKVRLIKSASG
jgi:hypothetical protein